MRRAADVARIATSALLLTIAILTILAVPGFLSNASSTVPVGTTTEVSR